MTDRVNPTINSKGSQIGPSAINVKMSRNRRIELLSYQTEELQGRNYCWPIRRVLRCRTIRSFVRTPRACSVTKEDQYRSPPRSRSISPNGHHTISIKAQIPTVTRKDLFRRTHTTQPMSEQRTTKLTKPSPFPPHRRPTKAPATIEQMVPMISRGKLRGSGVEPDALASLSETVGDA